MTTKIEEVAIALYEQGPELAIDYLTKYRFNTASEALTSWIHPLISHCNA